MYVTVFSTLVTMDYEKFATAYMLTDEGKGVIAALIQGYKEPAIALNCGIMIRECIKQRCLHEYMLDNSSSRCSRSTPSRPRSRSLPTRSTRFASCCAATSSW